MRLEQKTWVFFTHIALLLESEGIKCSLLSKITGHPLWNLNQVYYWTYTYTKHSHQTENCRNVITKLTGYLLVNTKTQILLLKSFDSTAWCLKLAY